MNALTTADDKPSHDEVIRVLENSLYPGAKRESIELVLGLLPRQRARSNAAPGVHRAYKCEEARRHMGNARCAYARYCRLSHQGGTQR